MPTFRLRITRARLLSIVLSLFATAPAWAISGIEGTFEFGFDAPWRIEPSVGADGELEYGMIPIQLTIHDANQVQLDQELARSNFFDATAPPVPLPGPQRLHAFCQLTVSRTAPSGNVVQHHYDFDDLAEVEMSRGSWQYVAADSAPTSREVCRQDQGETCPGMAVLADSSEWYGLAWQPVPADASPGDTVHLELEVVLSRDAQADCTLNDPGERVTLRNHVAVELAEWPLPRFGVGWLYGDLHYHSQGTDNEGEAGHNYRGVVRAMGAMGLDFAFATEHASAAQQIIDTDVSAYLTDVDFEHDRGALRDMNDQRFQALLADLLAPDGVNREAATLAGAARLPQSTLAAGTTPQIFLGGEVDIIPEVRDGFPTDLIEVGNGFPYSVLTLCGGWNFKLALGTGCSLEARYEAAQNGFLIRDIQGLNDADYGRLHLVYLPRSSADTDAFVASSTRPFGGAARRLADSHSGFPPVGPEIRDHGYAFIAHPMSGMTSTGKGPDGMPWTEHMLEKAFAEPAILGLQLWNEDTRFEHKLEKEEYDGYERFDSIYGTKGPVDEVRNGFYTGHFELDASAFLKGEVGERVDLAEHSLLDKIGHGTFLWDQMNLWGLDEARTSALGWVSEGEPRRVFMAGGSDAHGDFNYRREGYFLGDEKVTDTALGKPRNLVDAGVAQVYAAPDFALDGVALEGSADAPGAPEGQQFFTAVLSSATSAESTLALDSQALDTGHTGPLPIHSQEQVVDAIAAGRFAVTDGPALRLVIDNNRDGKIDPGDTPMGGIVDLYGESELPLIVDWISTDEFGGITRIDFIVGTANGSQTRLYGPRFHGARGLGLPSPYPVDSYVDGWRYDLGDDQYWQVTGQQLDLQFPDAPLQGRESVPLDLQALVAGPGADVERLFVRAVARTQAGVQRFAYTNPIWAIQRDASACPADATNPIDFDGDGLPDGCDPCPETHAGEQVACLGVVGDTTIAPETIGPVLTAPTSTPTPTLTLAPLLRAEEPEPESTAPLRRR